MINIDFETYSDINLKDVGLHKYAMDKSTDIICLGYSLSKDDISRIWYPGLKPPVELFEKIKNGDLVYAWNAEFEMEIWENVVQRLFRWLKIPFSQWRDTQAIALTLSLPASLGKCAEALDLPVQKDKRGSYLISKLSKPQRLSEKWPHKRWTKEYKPELYEEMYDYCKRDIDTDKSILDTLKHYVLKDRELDTWRKVIIKNKKGIPIDTELVKKVIENMDEYIEEMSGLVPIICDGEFETINQRDKIIRWANKEGYFLENLTADTVKSALEDPKINSCPEVKNILEIRQLIGKSSIKKYKKLNLATCNDKRIRGCLKYHKAGTGREGGRLLQPQNMPRATVDDVEHAIDLFKHGSIEDILQHYPDLLYTASALLRPSICASPGKHLKVADYSSIENRMICWLAGQFDILDLVKKGLNQYIDMAATLYNIPYEEISKDSEIYRHGKLTILGGGYGMGYKKFHGDCNQKGFKISLQDSKNTIGVFREKYHMVKDFWYDLKKTAINAINDRFTYLTCRDIGFMCNDTFLFMILPNQKCIAYPYPEIDYSSWAPNIKHKGLINNHWRWVYLSPSRLAENASQGTSAERFMLAQKDVIAAGYNVILTVHDEIGTEDDDGFGSLEELIKLMCKEYKVYEGLPLKAEGFITRRFKK